MPESSSSVDEDSTKKDATLLEDKVPPSSEEFTNVDQANEAKVKTLQTTYIRMIEDFEHEFAALQDQTTNTIDKLRKQKEEDSQRITEMERWVHERVSP